MSEKGKSVIKKLIFYETDVTFLIIYIYKYELHSGSDKRKVSVSKENALY